MIVFGKSLMGTIRAPCHRCGQHRLLNLHSFTRDNHKPCNTNVRPVMLCGECTQELRAIYARPVWHVR